MDAEHDRGRQSGARRAHPGSQPVRERERRRVQGQHRETHHDDRVGALAGDEERRRHEDVEQRRVVVEEVAVGQEPLHPSPDYVEVLRFVRVDPVAERRDDLEDHGEAEERDDRRALPA